MNRELLFKNELEYIKDNDIKESLVTLLNNVPEYFFSVEASSTGKYHPSYALGEGGLVRHTKAAARMAYELFGIYKFPDRIKDLIIVAIVLHDSCKKGEVEEKYTRFDHPLVACTFIKKNASLTKLSKDDIEFVCDCISSHMGRFNTSEYSDVILPIPKSPEQKFVHMCDYLASRKVIQIKFDKDNNIIEE